MNSKRTDENNAELQNCISDVYPFYLFATSENRKAVQVNGAKGSTQTWTVKLEFIALAVGKVGEQMRREYI